MIALKILAMIFMAPIVIVSVGGVFILLLTIWAICLKTIWDFFAFLHYQIGGKND